VGFSTGSRASQPWLATRLLRLTELETVRPSDRSRGRSASDGGAKTAIKLLKSENCAADSGLCSHFS